MKELTKAEEQVMTILWELKECFVKEIVEKFDDPKPAYNTVSTIIRILEKKGFVGHQDFGKTYRYFPLVSKEEYKKTFLSGFVKNYFNNSYQQLVSFFASSENLSVKEIEEIKKVLEENTKKSKK